jgi:predicted phosphoribosyltransferase
MRFTSRIDAAGMLASRLAAYRNQHALVLGVPRGAVPMARLIADRLNADLDVVLVRKLRAPDQPELAIGAVDEAGTVLKGRYFDYVSPDHVREEVRTQREILRQRRRLYTQAHPAVDPRGRVVIIVDDGVATGSSMLAAIRSVRARHPRQIVVAIAVAPPASLDAMRAEADDVVCLYSTDDFYAVGQFFDDFSEVTDEMVVAALTREAIAVAR